MKVLSRIVVRRVVIALIIVLLAYIGYSKRLQISARIWHWKYGYSAQVGNYNVPVPDNWLVLSQGQSDLTLTYVSRKQSLPSAFPVAPMITISSLPVAVANLDFWKSRQQGLLETDKVRQVEQRTLMVGDEKVICIGGSVARDVFQVPQSDLISLECRSSGTLDVMFSGSQSEVQRFYDILGEIHRFK